MMPLETYRINGLQKLSWVEIFVREDARFVLR
jgi:hypothetical protein